MTREELIKLHIGICEKARKMMEGKNIDYASGTTDPFANFRATEVLGVKAEIGILMRCMDKFARIQSFVKNGTLAVKSESVRDAIEDNINYMVLLAGVIQDREDSRPKIMDAPTPARDAVTKRDVENNCREETRNIKRDDTNTMTSAARCAAISDMIRAHETGHQMAAATPAILVHNIKTILQRDT